LWGKAPAVFAASLDRHRDTRACTRIHVAADVRLNDNDTLGAIVKHFVGVIVRTVFVVFACGTLAAATPGTDAGWRAYRGGDYAAARAIYEQGATKGDRLAQFNLAMMLLRGEGGRADIDGGVVWLRKAAEAGLPQGQYNLGLLYENGVGVTRSLTAATEWWQKAADQGHTEAQVQVATQYFLGRGAPKDWKLAAKWYEAAAQNGDAGAQYIMGSFYEHGDGVPQDLKKALEWYVAAAKQGDAGAAVQAKDVARRLAEGTKP
jgi:TPR repeat protein